MPYNEQTGEDVPNKIKGKKKRRQWAHVWNGEYAAHGDEGRAFATANSVASKIDESEDEMESVKKVNNELEIFCPLVKVDVAKREVWGVVTAELPDKTDEICDYETTVPYYEEVVAEMSKATDGKNIFPLRAMHGLTAAGKGISIEFRKDKKEIFMGFKVVDDAEWKKVEEDVYTGFSQGGQYIKRWKDGNYTRYTARPGEVSLVDLPCLTRAHFEVVKADGTVELHKFSKRGDIPTEAGALPIRPTSVEAVQETTCDCDCAACKANNCAGCTMAGCNCSQGVEAKAVKYMKWLLEKGNNGEPALPYTDDAGHPKLRLLLRAWDSLHDAKRNAKYEGSDKLKLVRKIKQVYAQLGIENPLEKMDRIGKELESLLKDAIQSRAYGQLGKGMYTVSRFAQIAEDLKYLWLALEYEREEEADSSPATDDLKEVFRSLLDSLLLYTEEQVEEAHASLEMV